MDKKRRISECKILILFLCMGIAALFTDQIQAYLSAEDAGRNRFSIGGSNIEILEEFDPTQATTPGNGITKDVKVKNGGPNECYVRVKAVFTDSDVEQYCTVDWNDVNWSHGTDGYWYYIEPLSDGETTISLFTRIDTSASMPQAIIERFEMIVYAESCQAKGFTDHTAAWSHYHSNRT